ncbi:hypothetical protein BCR34DRAFT_572125 [Clohesyomyces aquaticus]|uniref:Uncharacterized protein n=1 Tax=Clohesyomyces aquaticus TaxID=1231657 RepID=A0A1Y1Z594_9PLEO|nr:hypothetical protein BCR34DRAFT_572125 [Clohesyomyces aquaticus]
MVAKLQEMTPGDVFSELSEVDVLKRSDDEDLWVTRPKWGFGKVTGEDIVTIVGGRVKTLYTFLNKQ